MVTITSGTAQRPSRGWTASGVRVALPPMGRRDAPTTPAGSVDEQRGGRFQKAAQRLYKPGRALAVDEAVVERRRWILHAPKNDRAGAELWSRIGKIAINGVIPRQL